MKALDYGEIITGRVEELQDMLKKAHEPLIRRRLRFLLLLKQNKGMSRATAGKKPGLLPSGAQDMWEMYRKAGIESFSDYPFKGRKSYLDQDQKSWLQQELKKDSTTSLSRACQIVEEHTGVHYGVSGMHYVFDCLGVKKKTGRPSHVDKQPQQVEAFKKKDFPQLSQTYSTAVYFEDEMRSGTRTRCKRRWTPRGHRPECRMKSGYQYCYLYAALNPYTGSLFSLILPDMTKDSFCLFTQHFSHYPDELYGVHSEQRNKVLLIADGAGAHQEQLCTDSGFHFQKLPPASPELNPAERFFEELRKDLANHVFDTLEQVEEHLISILQHYYQNPQTVIQLTQYPYIRLPI